MAQKNVGPTATPLIPTPPPTLPIDLPIYGVLECFDGSEYGDIGRREIDLLPRIRIPTHSRRTTLGRESPKPANTHGILFDQFGADRVE
jgi:hypothetical protein